MPPKGRERGFRPTKYTKHANAITIPEAARRLTAARGLRQALVVFENVVGLEPKNYIGDNMQKVTDVYRIAQYNVACCYSMISQTDAAIDALKAALISGFDDYKCASHSLPALQSVASLSHCVQHSCPSLKRAVTDSVTAILRNGRLLLVLDGSLGRLKARRTVVCHARIACPTPPETQQGATPPQTTQKCTAALTRAAGAWGWDATGRMIRTDASLETVRKDPRFKQLIDRFDEPLLNENAMKVLKGMFGRK
jgi:hypothetical protein